jgi:hypothetical protein
MQEGDEVWLRAYIARCDDEQALIGFMSMEGDYSVRVPLDELAPRGDAAIREAVKDDA